MENKTKLIVFVIGIAIVTVGMIAYLRGQQPPPRSAVVTVRPLPPTATATPRPTATARPTSTPMPTSGPMTVITRVVIGGDVAVIIVTATPGGAPLTVAEAAAMLATHTPTPRVTAATVTTSTTTRGDMGINDAGFSPLPTPVSPLETPPPPTRTPPPLDATMPEEDIAFAAYQLMNDLVVAETLFYNTHGHYAQLILAATATCPVGQACITLDYPPGLVAGVDIYIAPNGIGYSVKIHAGCWTLTTATGPETWRSEGWNCER